MCSNASFHLPSYGGTLPSCSLLSSSSDKVCLVPLTCGWHSKRRKQRSLFILCLLTTAPPQSPCRPPWSLSSPLESRAAAAEEDSMTETNPLHPNTRMHQQNIIERYNKITSRGATNYHMKIWSQLNEIYSNLVWSVFFALCPYWFFSRQRYLYPLPVGAASPTLPLGYPPTSGKWPECLPTHPVSAKPTTLGRPVGILFWKLWHQMEYFTRSGKAQDFPFYLYIHHAVTYL